MVSYYQDFIPRIAEQIPDLRPVVREHLEAFDEILPALLMGDVHDWAERMAAHDPALTSRLLTQLDRTLEEGDPDAVNAVKVSFLEPFIDQSDHGSELRALLTPRLSGVLEQMVASPNP